MNAPILQLLKLFDALPAADKRSVLAEILRRNPLGEEDLTADSFDQLADELFSRLDSEDTSQIA